MIALTISTERTGYSIDQCDKGVTIDGLIEMLERYRDYLGGDTYVFFNNDDGYTYGTLRSSSLNEEDYDDEGMEDGE